MQIKLLGFSAALAFFGILDTAYLTYSHFFELPLPCTIGGGCDIVTRSSYSTVLGIHLSVYGLIFYLGMFVLALWVQHTERKLVWNLLFLGGKIGLLASLYFIYLQIFVIGAYCLYCLFSAAISIVNFVILSYLWNKRRGIIVV